MKQFYIIFFILLLGCSASTGIKKSEWLIGTWSRTNAAPGQSGVEIWSKVSDTEMAGLGINLKGTDTSFVEKMKIIVKDNVIYFVADVPENNTEVFFKLTSQYDTSMTFENPEHDFPKKISYAMAGEKLKATISGDGKIIDYWFEKK